MAKEKYMSLLFEEWWNSKGNNTSILEFEVARDAWFASAEFYNQGGLEKKLESRDFYELCQQYRHAKIDAAEEFGRIKDYLLTGRLPWPSYEDG